MNERLILLVEDNSNDEELTMRALKRHSVEARVVCARDGAEALDYLLANGDGAGAAPRDVPSLVLLDLKLPKVDGLEVLRRMREHDRTRLVPVVVLTSSREERDLLESYRLGANAYVVKPVAFDQFLDAVRSLGLFWAVLNEPPPDDARKAA